MFNRKFGLRRKRAGITVELLLAVVLAVVVLFLILGLFSNNLKHMVVNGNISRIFANNSAKTAYSSWGANPTQTQVNVQTVADNGLDWYLDQAQAALTNYIANPPKNADETMDLAKWATILRLGGVLDENIRANFIIPNNINIDFSDHKNGITTVTIDGKTKSISYPPPPPPPSNKPNPDPMYSPPAQLFMIKEVFYGTFK